MQQDLCVAGAKKGANESKRARGMPHFCEVGAAILQLHRFIGHGGVYWLRGDRFFQGSGVSQRIGMHRDGTFVHPLANGIGKLPIVKRCPGGYRVEQGGEGVPSDMGFGDITENSLVCFMQGSYLDGNTVHGPHDKTDVETSLEPIVALCFLSPPRV
jgi:hypothetical protein